MRRRCGLQAGTLFAPSPKADETRRAYALRRQKHYRSKYLSGKAFSACSCVMMPESGDWPTLHTSTKTT